MLPEKKHSELQRIDSMQSFMAIRVMLNSIIQICTFDEIDWNAEVDHNLMLDFDSEPVVPDVDSNHEPVLDFGDVLPDPYKDYSPYGWGDSDDKIKNSRGTSNDMNKDQGGINWDDYIDNGRINWDSCDGGANNDWWDWNENDNKAGEQGCNGYVNDNDYYPAYGNVLPDPYKDYSPYGWGDSDDKIKNSWGTSNDMNKDQGGVNWDDYIDNGRINWDSCDRGMGGGRVGSEGSSDPTTFFNPMKNFLAPPLDRGANNDWWDWNENDNKAGDQGCNGYVNGNDYYPTYGNVHNERYMSSHKPSSFHGNNSQRSRFWRNNGSWRKTTGESYGSQHGHWSSFQAHGRQRIHVSPRSLNA